MSLGSVDTKIDADGAFFGGILDEEDSTLQNFSGFVGNLNLPPHFRCAAHTLNLVATNDAAKAVSRCDIYGSCFESVMTKLRTLWTRQSKSSLASDKIKERMKRLFKLEVKTRWNSSYDALRHIDDLSPAEKNDLNKLMEDLNLKIGEFRAAEFAFIKEYVEVMRPLAHSLDCLQGEGVRDGDDPHLGMGYLVPIIGALKYHYDTKFEEMQADSTCLRFCGKLVECIRDGLAKRFSAALKDDELLIAAAVHPKFRLQSMLFLDVSERDRIARLVKQRVADFVRESGSAHPSGAVINDDVPEPLDVDGNMPVAEADAPNPPKKKKSSLNKLLGPIMRKLREAQPSSQGTTIDANFLLNQQIDAFLNGGSDDNVKAFMGLEPLKKLFIETNTGLPSSAPVERLFSVAGHIFLPSRSRLKDRLLEPIVFLRANLKLLGL